MLKNVNAKICNIINQFAKKNKYFFMNKFIFLIIYNMGNSSLSKTPPNTNKKFLNWLYYLKNGYNKEDYSKAVLEETETETDTDSNTIKQIKKDVAALSLTVKSSNSFLSLTKNTIFSYVIILVLFLIILSLNINILTKATCKVTEPEYFSNRDNWSNRTSLHPFY